MKQPQDHSRRILLAVTGLTPQIVTETLYWLTIKQQPPFVPTEVQLITTAEGAERAKLSLLHPQSGVFDRLRTDYSLPPIAFRPEHIHVLKDAGGRPLGDIRSPEDNERTADTITDMVRDLTRDDDCALHVSIAGGRKTMGFYIGYALSLYGREQDRLSHVLVSEPYESIREFYYPTPKSKLIHTPGPKSRPYDAKEAEVTLAKIPFVRLRGLDIDPMEGRTTYSAAVANAQRALPPVALELDPASCTVTAGGESFEMEHALFATYWMLAERARRGEPGVYSGEPGVVKERLLYYGRVVGPESDAYRRAEETFLSSGGVRSEGAATRKLDKLNFNPDKAKIRQKLKDHLGRRRAEPYQIKKQDPIKPEPGRPPCYRFGLTLPPDAIRIAGGQLAGSGSTRRTFGEGGPKKP